MTTAETPTLGEALSLARRLPPRDRARLIAQLVADLAEGAQSAAVLSTAFALPVLTGGTWIDDLPLSRKDLYGDDERC
jgi:hypothetical protein